MKKLVLGAMAMMIIGTGVYADDFTGEIVYIQVRTDNKIATKIKDDQGVEHYVVTAQGGTENSKAIYAMYLTAMTSGKKLTARTNSSGLVDQVFLLP